MELRESLPANTTLDGSYRLQHVIGAGGFGITYLASDLHLQSHVAVKEYFPAALGERDKSLSVHPRSDQHKDSFERGRASFLKEAQTLAQFKHPSIVRVRRVFEANATAYMVMDFEQGQDFETWLRTLGRPPTQAELDAIVAPLLGALEVMHARSFLHRDIAPDNIVIRPDGSPVLLDFGAARRAMAESSRSLTGIVKAGFSPHEQYAVDSRRQGPWSDLYALGATLYRAVTGAMPEEATLRLDDDRLKPTTEVGRGRYRPQFLRGIDACMRVAAAERPQSVADLRPLLLGTGADGVAMARAGWGRRVAAVLAAAGLLAAGYWLVDRTRTDRGGPHAGAPEAPLRTATRTDAREITTGTGRPSPPTTEDAAARAAAEQRAAAEGERLRQADEAQRKAEAERRAAADEENRRRGEEERRQAAERERRAAADAEASREAEATRRRAEEERHAAAEANTKRKAEAAQREEAERRVAAVEAQKKAQAAETDKPPAGEKARPADTPTRSASLGVAGYDGSWTFTRTITVDCGVRGSVFTVVINSGVVHAPGGRGSVSGDGRVSFPGKANYFKGRLAGNSGSGTYDGRCSGTFTARRR